MEIFRLDKVIENERLDLEMAIAQLKELEVTTFYFFKHLAKNKLHA